MNLGSVDSSTASAGSAIGRRGSLRDLRRAPSDEGSSEVGGSAVGAESDEAPWLPRLQWPRLEALQQMPLIRSSLVVPGPQLRFLVGHMRCLLIAIGTGNQG